MNEEYLKGVFEHFGGESKLGATYEEWANSISNDSEYKQGMFNSFGGEDKMGSSYEEWNNSVFGDVKKKENGEDISPSLEEPIVSEEKASVGDVSTREREVSYDQQQSDIDLAEKVESGEYRLSHKDQREKQPVNYMGLFDKKDKVKSANESGVSINFAEQASKAAAQAERPIEYLSKARHLRKRVDYLKENFSEVYAELLPIDKQLEQADSRTIDGIEEQLGFIESKIRESQTLPSYVGIEEIATTPEWNKYKNEILEDPTRIAVQRLQDDSDKLRKAASIPKSDLEKKSEAIHKQYTDDELDAFDSFARDTRAMMGRDKELIKKYDSFKKQIDDLGVSAAYIRSIGKGVGRGVQEYVEGYTMLTDDLKKNKAVTELLDKADKIEKGEDIEFTSDDRILMKALAENSQLHEELDKDISDSYKIGEATGQSIGFMLEFVLSGGGAGKVGKAVAKQAVKRSIAKGVGVTAKASATKKFGIGMAIKLSQMGTQVPKMPSFYKKMAENV